MAPALSWPTTAATDRRDDTRDERRCMKLPEALGVVLSGRVAQGVGLGAGGGLMLLGTGGLVGD